jgi:hypothetical protein
MNIRLESEHSTCKVTHVILSLGSRTIMWPTSHHFPESFLVL